MKVVPALLSLALGASAFADSPLRPPADFRVCDRSASYCAYVSTTEGTIVYAISGKFRSREIYRVPGWHRDAHLSTDGRYFVSGFDGLNLVPLNVSRDQVMISIYRNGKLIHDIRLKQLYNSLGSMPRTSSHFQWGWINSVTNELIHLRTEEGNVYVALETGVVSLPRPPVRSNPNPSLERP